MEATSSINARLADAPKPRKSRLRKILNFFLFGILLLLLAAFVWQKIWMRSGSNEWILEMEKNGVQVYSLKAPNASVKKYKGIMRGKYTFSQIFTAMVADASLKNCQDWYGPLCSEFKFVKPFNPDTMSNFTYWKFNFQFPLAPLDSIVNAQVVQDPETKELVIDMIAAPNLLPRDPCCVRMAHMHNRWRYTPLPGGEVEIEFTQDMSLDSLTNFLMNLAGKHNIYTLLHDQLPGLLTKEEYSQARYDFIEEVNL